jgi:hypothetical protein
VFVIALGNMSGNNPTSWLNYVLHVVPSIVFVSSYMNLVTFLADLYYSHSNYNNHLAKPAMILVVVCSYILLTFMALITFGKKKITNSDKCL